MPHNTRSWIVAFAALWITARPVAGEPNVRSDTMPDPMKDWPRPELRPGRTDAQIAAAIAEHAKQLHDTRHFSGVVVAARAGKIAVSRAYGLANLAASTPNTLETRFNIGSLNKLFTKVAIAQLAEAGKLSLDDRLRTHLPSLPVAAADRITIGQLLEHRSGMGDIFGPNYTAAPPSRLRELDDFVPLFADQPLEFEPGTSQRYSNAGYIALGLVVEKLAGETYRDYVQKHVFAPARMASTGLWAIDERVARCATGYTRRGDDPDSTVLVPNTDTLPGRPSSAGGAFSTAGDLLRFWQALLAGKLLSPRWTSWMVNGSFDDPRRTPTVGLGGGAPGVNAAIETSGEWIVIALANLDPPSAIAVASGAMDIIRGHRVERKGLPMVRYRSPSGPASVELTGEVVVPAAMSGHLFTVEARVDGKGPFRFVVDTGSAGMLRISSAVQQALGLAQVGEAFVADPSGKNRIKQAVVRARTVEIGGARFSGVEATVGDSPRGLDLAGVIGLGLFANLTATLDYPRGELRLGRRPLSSSDAHAVAFTTEHGVPVIDVDIGGVAVKVDVDTGSPALLSIPSSWTGQLSWSGEPKVVGKGRTVTSEFEIRRAELRGELRVAGFAQASPAIDIVDHFPVASLGSRFLQRYALTFDLANRRMALAP